MSMFRIVILFLMMSMSQALVTPLAKTKGTPRSFNVKVPKYDKGSGMWVATDASQLPEAGYPPTKTFFLHGPKLYFTRLFQPDDYEQAVLTFMAGDKCSRDEAQGNMDAYLRNPQDWQFLRVESEKRGIKYDYTTLKTDQIVLTSTWSLIVASLAARAAYCLSTGDFFWSILPWVNR